MSLYQGDIADALEGIFDDPGMLGALTRDDIESAVSNDPDWRAEGLGKSKRPGVIFRETKNGKLTGRIIQGIRVADTTGRDHTGR